MSNCSYWLLIELTVVSIKAESHSAMNTMIKVSFCSAMVIESTKLCNVGNKYDWVGRRTVGTPITSITVHKDQYCVYCMLMNLRD